MGAVSPAVSAAAAAPSSPPAQATATVTVTVGGMPAAVAFAGLAPGFIGLYQINANMPSGVASGSAVPVLISAAGAVSPAVTLAVQ